MKSWLSDGWSRRTLQLVVLSTLLLSGLQWSGLLDRTFGWVYDAIMRSGPAAQGPSPVLLLEARGESLDQDEVLGALAELQRLGAAQIVFAAPLPDASGRLRAALDQIRVPVVVAQGADGSAPATASNAIQTAVSVLPPLEAGVARRQYIGGASQPALEVAAARRSVGDALPAGATYVVNFSAGRGYLARANLELAAQGKLIEELVRGRTVVIGSGASRPGLYTPLGEPTLSLLEFQGWALDSLLQQRTVRWVDGAAVPAILLAIALGSVVFYVWVSLRFAAAATAGLLLLYAALAWVCLHTLAVWLPLAAMCLLQLLLLLGVFRLKENQRERSLRELLLASSVKLRERVVPASFYSKKDPWADVIAMVNQVLGLDRMIFLDRVEEDHRVREIASYQCSLDDIGEKRRDYERTPYITAIQQRGPLRLDRHYLKDAGIQDEVQFLVPLAFSGQILGFWALGIRRSRMEECVGFVGIVRDFGEQIAELLYHRGLYREREASRTGGSALIGRTLGLRSGTSAHELLTPVLELLGRRQDTLERVVNGLSTPFGLYDLFGHVVHVNSAMETFARANALKLYDASALDVVRALTGREEDETRGYILTAVTERRPVTVPVTLGPSHHAYLLRIQALEPDEKAMTGSAQPAPFRSLGLLLELRDISDVGEALDRSRVILEAMCARLDQDLITIERASAGGRGALDGASLADLGQHVRDARDSVAESVRLVREVSIPGAAAARVAPVDVTRVLLRAQSRHAEALGARRLSLQMPSARLIAMADQDNLARMLQQLIGALIDDAAEGTAIRIDVADAGAAEGSARLLLSNTGFGIPDERVQFLLHNDTGNDSALDRLAECRRLCESWGGRLAARGVIGSGLQFEVELVSAVSAKG